MRQEQIKNSFYVNGVEVFDTGDEFVFFSKNEKGEEIEHHLAKKDPFPVKDKQTIPLKRALEKAIDEAKKIESKNSGV